MSRHHRIQLDRDIDQLAELTDIETAYLKRLAAEHQRQWFADDEAHDEHSTARWCPACLEDSCRGC